MWPSNDCSSDDCTSAAAISDSSNSNGISFAIFSIFSIIELIHKLIRLLNQFDVFAKEAQAGGLDEMLRETGVRGCRDAKKTGS